MQQADRFRDFIGAPQTDRFNIVLLGGVIKWPDSYFDVHVMFFFCVFPVQVSLVLSSPCSSFLSLPSSELSRMSLEERQLCSPVL